MSGRLCLVTSCNNCRFCLKPETTMTEYKQPQTVTTDALATLGTIIDPSCGRDAIHLAVENVTAGEKLFPGQHVSLAGGVSKASGKLVGIVDPFLPGAVHEGQRFWLVVYPRQITSLRHVWEHPDFPASNDAAPVVDDLKAASEAWMRSYAEEIDEGYGTLIEAATAHLDSGEYFYGAASGGYHGKFEGESTHPDFWHHYQVITGRVVPSGDQGNFFTCSC